MKPTQKYVLLLNLYGLSASSLAAANVPQPEHKQVHVVEEVKVTGQKIDRDLQQTVDSITVLSGAELESIGVVDLRDAFRLMGNVNYSPSNRGNAGFSIRGINSEGIGEGGGNSSAVSSLVIDGAVQSIEGVRKGARGVWDLKSVEV